MFLQNTYGKWSNMHQKYMTHILPQFYARPNVENMGSRLRSIFLPRFSFKLHRNTRASVDKIWEVAYHKKQYNMLNWMYLDCFFSKKRKNTSYKNELCLKKFNMFLKKSKYYSKAGFIS